MHQQQMVVLSSGKGEEGPAQRESARRRSSSISHLCEGCQDKSKSRIDIGDVCYVDWNSGISVIYD
jgi:hypothetical protein